MIRAYDSKAEVPRYGLYSGNPEPQPRRLTDRQALRAIAEDTRRHAEEWDAPNYHTLPETHGQVSANVGDLMAAAMAAAGSFALVMGGRTACETDYLAARGATFPDIPLADLEAFNRRTLRPDMDESAEHSRYAQIAKFFRRGA